MMNQFFKNPATLARLYAGPLGPHMDSLAKLLCEQDYAKATIQKRLRAVSDMSHWLERQALPVDELSEEEVVRFLEEEPRSPVLRKSRVAFRILLDHLREAEVVPPKRVSSPCALDEALQEYTLYLIQDRGLAPSTISNYCHEVRRFLHDRFGEGSFSLEELTPADVTQYVLRSSGHAKQRVCALRSYLRFLHLHNPSTSALAAAVLGAAPRRPKPPETLAPAQVQILLDSCDRSRVAGQRDYAILLLLARLGLRAAEVVGLKLADLDWHSGVLTVRGKGHRQDRLPMLSDVGEALVAYLREGRPQCPSQRVFLRLQAPYRGLARSSCVSWIVREALRRAGLTPARKGAHLLRHSLATHMLAQGVCLEEIGQILRHRDLRTTQVYAQVDMNALRELALPWPGGEV